MKKKELVIAFVFFILLIYFVAFTVYGISPFGVDSENTFLNSIVKKTHFITFRIEKSSVFILLSLTFVSGFFIGKNEINQLIAFILGFLIFYFLNLKVLSGIKIHSGLLMEKTLNTYIVSLSLILFSIPYKNRLLKTILFLFLMMAIFYESYLFQLYIVGLFSSIAVGFVFGLIFKKFLEIVF